MYATALALAILLAQGTPQWFTGTWTAEFGGRTFVRVELEERGGKPGGRMGIGNIEVHPDGTLRKVAPVPALLSAIFDAVSNDAMLSFSRKAGNDTDRFELRRIGDHGELSLITSDELRRQLAAEGLPIPKPIRLTKVSK
jgi:hypothetical protein